MRLRQLTASCDHMAILWTIQTTTRKWQEQNKQQENLPAARRQESSWPQRQRANRHQPQAVSRNPTDTDQEPSLFVRSDVTRNPLSSSSASCHSSVLFVRLPRITKLIFVSRDQRSWHYKNLPRRTSSVSSRTPTWLPSTRSV